MKSVKGALENEIKRTVFYISKKDMTLKPHERRQNQAGPLRKKKPGRVPNGLSLDLHKDRLNHNNHQHHHSDQENNPRLAHTHSKKKKHLQKKHRPRRPGRPRKLTPRQERLLQRRVEENKHASSLQLSKEVESQTGEEQGESDSVAPDLNPIEHLWGILKRQVEHHSPSSIQSLKEVILEEWKKIDVAKCCQLVHSMPRRLGAVIKNHGDHTHY
ncbi:Transposable element Tc3 transposase [Anabarilius grahami]|uniref:Transposable element Tc3 transposase n=1 Tax=Anabarilius grahami TaxID=495550 RepID=A0A3N0Z7N6_ANAGA|nr:Transposable element Tc3 transposase [Anabarilius grahami]